MTACIQLLTAFLGSLGFALLFNVRGNKLLPASLGGLLSWGVYLLAGLFTASDPLRYLIASITFTLYAEILARVLKTPATLFLVSAAIPLIPGGSLYRTMEYAMQGDSASFGVWGLATLLLAASIAAGILLTMAVVNMATHFPSVRRLFF